MKDEEYRETMGGVLIYGILGCIAAHFGLTFLVGFFGCLMVFRGYPALRLLFIRDKKEENEQNKG